MPTIYDVARRAAVSTYTVSSVLNRSAYVSPELTARVQKAVRDLDYTVNDLARSLQMRKTRTVGMLIPDIASPYYARVVQGVEDVLRAAAYSLILGSSYDRNEEQSRYLTMFRSKQVDGTLLFLAPGGDADARALVRAGKPVVFVGRVPSFAADSVSADDIEGARSAVAHLIGKGHRRIALIAGPAGLSTSADRVTGWRRALRKARLSAPKELVAEGDWTPESGYRLALEFLDLREPPTAVFAANFLMMTGVLRALDERRLRCPADVEVIISGDCAWLDVFSPPISTVVQPSFELGRQAAELILKRIQSPARRFERVVLPPDLHIRGTQATAAAPAAVN